MYKQLKKIMFLFSPENAHNLAEFGFKYSGKLTPCALSYFANKFFINDKKLHQDLFGHTFYNPVGLGAGFDKNATMFKALVAIGFGHIEYGTVTPKAQSGNPKPRLFRYPEQESIQNAMGFNNDGLYEIKKRVSKEYPFCVPLGANIGKNKTTTPEDTLRDYEALIKELQDVSDYIAINVSSPNTPGLRDFQNEEFIKELFIMATSLTKKAVLLKIAPDMGAQDAIDLCACAVENGASGIIATNTTIDYSLLPNPQNFGGISGRVLKEKSKELFTELAKEFYGKTALISVGGISDGDDAYERILEGASLVQVYSSFIFQGPSLLKEINTTILRRLKEDGFEHISEAIGSRR